MKLTLFALPLLAALQSPQAHAAGSYYDWDSFYAGRCYEYTNRGQRIRQVPLNYCRQTRGSYYDWDSFYAGRCYEYTPRGQRIQQVPSNYCR